MPKTEKKTSRQEQCLEEEKVQDSTTSYAVFTHILAVQLSISEKIERIKYNQETISSIHPVTWACCRDKHIHKLLIAIQGYELRYAEEKRWKTVTLLDGALSRLVIKMAQYQNPSRFGKCSECHLEISEPPILMEKCFHSFHRDCYKNQKEDCCQACTTKCVLCDQEINFSTKPDSLVLTTCFHIFHNNCWDRYQIFIQLQRLSLRISNCFSNSSMRNEEVYHCPQCSNDGI